MRKLSVGSVAPETPPTGPGFNSVTQSKRPKISQTLALLKESSIATDAG